MLHTRVEIANAALLLADRLRLAEICDTGGAWTEQVFEQLREFCVHDLQLQRTECFHKNHPDGQNEFVWDFIAVRRNTGILLAAESEQATRKAGEVTDLKHDFEKLLYVFAPLRVLICKAVDGEHLKSLIEALIAYADGCCTNFNPGAAFLLHFRLPGGKDSRTYIWQSKGYPNQLSIESLKFVPLIATEQQ